MGVLGGNAGADEASGEPLNSGGHVSLDPREILERLAATAEAFAQVEEQLAALLLAMSNRGGAYAERRRQVADEARREARAARQRARRLRQEVERLA